MDFRGVVSGCEETRDTIKVCFMARELTSQKYNSHCVLVRVQMGWNGAGIGSYSCTTVDAFAPPCAMCGGPCGKPCLSLCSRYGRVMSHA